MGIPCSLDVSRVRSPSVHQILRSPWSAAVIRQSRSRFCIVHSLQICCYHLIFCYFTIVLYFLLLYCAFCRSWKMLTSSTVSAEWRRIAQGPTVDYGTQLTQKISYKQLTLLHPVQTSFAFLLYPLTLSHLLTSPLPDWTVPTSLKRPITDTVQPWTPVISGTIYVSKFSESGAVAAFAAPCVTYHLLPQSQSSGSGGG